MGRKKNKSRPSGFTVFRYELFKNNRKRFKKVKEAMQMADHTWRQMTKQEQDELVKIMGNFSSGLYDIDVTPLGCNF
jgi:hypothetical protein